MIFPVLCFTCGRNVSRFHDSYLKKIREGQSFDDIMKEYKMNRMCCRRMFLTMKELINEKIRAEERLVLVRK